MARIRGTSKKVKLKGSGDLNNDGYDDVIIGAPGADPNGPRLCRDKLHPLRRAGEFLRPQRPLSLNRQLLAGDIDL